MSPMGQEHGMAGGTSTVNNKIYYSLGCLREGADRNRCSLELAVRLEWGVLGVVPKRIKEGMCSAVTCQ